VLMWDGEAGAGARSAERIRDTWRTLGVHVPSATAHWNYLLTLIRKRAFDVALVRLSMESDTDLYEWFHSRGSLNFGGVSDRPLDGALVAYRAARDPAGRLEAKQQIANRIEQLHLVTVLRAPVEVMLASRRVEGIEFQDDLPRLDRLTLAPPGDDPWSK